MFGSRLDRKPVTVRNRIGNFDPSSNTRVFHWEGKGLILIWFFCLYFLNRENWISGVFSFQPCAVTRAAGPGNGWDWHPCYFPVSFGCSIAASESGEILPWQKEGGPSSCWSPNTGGARSHKFTSPIFNPLLLWPQLNCFAHTLHNPLSALNIQPDSYTG